MEASRCAYKRNIILNSVYKHNLHVTSFETNCMYSMDVTEMTKIVLKMTNL